jgi:outer membrane protein assembly factor BamB
VSAESKTRSAIVRCALASRCTKIARVTSRWLRRGISAAGVIGSVADCGSRTGVGLDEATPVTVLDASAGGHPADATTRVADARSSRPPDAAARDVEAGTPPSTDAGRFFTCPSEIPAGAPFAMLGNCSTRDGRARVAGPTSPHVTWTASAPSALSNGGFVAADSSGGVYIADTILMGNALVPTFGRIDGTSGALDWSTSLPSSTVASLSPFLNPMDTLVDFANDATGPILEVFSPSTGATVPTTLPSSLSGIGIPAVGADGSLYVEYVPVTGPQTKKGLVSRVLPDHTIAWTSEDLSVGPATFGGFLTLALGEHDEVIVVTTDTSGVLSRVYELSPMTGATLWSTDIPAQLMGGAAVGPDGSVAVIASENGSDYSLLYILEPTGAIRATASVGGQTIVAIGADGTILVDGLTAVSSAGATLWIKNAGGLGVQIDSDGTIIATSTGEIVGLDSATGEKRWSLDASDVPGFGRHCASIQSATLTSNGGLVGIGCNILFGASD